MSLLTYEPLSLNDSEVTEPHLVVEGQELDTHYEVFNAISEVEQLMHRTYAARKWGVTDYHPGMIRDLDMFAMRFSDGGDIEELVARDEVSLSGSNRVVSTYAVDIYSEGRRSQQLKMTNSGTLEVSAWQYDEHDHATVTQLDKVDKLNALYEFRYRMNIARDRVENRTDEQRAAADADANKKLKQFVAYASWPIAGME